jgi:signal transduction histidine kinase
VAREHAALAGRVISVQDNERMRIARNLHDDIGQEVTALRLMLELLANETAPQAIAAGIARAQRALESLDQRLHFVAGELRPAALDLGIAVALEHFVQQWSTTFGCRSPFAAAASTQAPVRWTSRRTSTGSLRKR